MKNLLKTFSNVIPVRRSRGLGLAGALALAASAFAQGTGGPTWVSLDSTVGPGTPPSVTLSPLSTKDRTILRISVPGFYVKTVTDARAGTFQKLSIPQTTTGLLVPAVQRVRGAPAVPVINMFVGIPSDASGCSVGAVTPLATSTLSGYRVVPDQPDVMEEESVDPGLVGPFEYDEAAYRGTAPYPAANGAALGPAGKMMGRRIQPMSVKPFKYTPATGMLQVYRQFDVEINHAGNALPQTREHILLARQFAKMCVNWNTPAANWVTAPDYKGAFLFITKADAVGDLTPLIDQKKERGYLTRVATESDVDTNHDGSMSATEVRTYIKNWHDSNSEELKYVILVGDVNRIPYAVEPNYGFSGDHYYACYEDDDFYQDVWLGRITFNSGQLPTIVSRILAYEDLPPGAAEYYSKALLVGHREVEAEFVDYLELASTTGFPADEPVTFSKVYGTDPVNGHNQTIFDRLGEGQHIVFYRGHGSPSTWYEWSNLGAHFYDWYPSTFVNYQHTSWSPIVINSACSNGALTDSDCIMEEWFQQPVGGAVATYGASTGSRRDMNHAFTLQFFGKLRNYGDGASISSLLSHSQLSAYLQTVSPDMTDPDKNIWVYGMLGDPEMKIWGKKPEHTAPTNFPSQGGANQPVDITVHNGHGDPIPGAVVSAFKQGEVREVVFADANGVAHLNLNPRTSGTMTLRAYTYDTRTLDTRVEIPVVICTADVDDGTGSGNPDNGVTIDDLLYYLAMFEQGEIRADVDDGSGTGTPDGGVTIDDLLYFLQRFEAGC